MGQSRKYYTRSQHFCINENQYKRDLPVYRIDHRLIKIIDALRLEGLDWLVLEIINGLSACKENVATEEELQSARDKIKNLTEQRDFERVSFFDQNLTTEIDGDEQISWAINYISDKFNEVFECINLIDTNMHELIGRDMEIVLGENESEKIIYPKNILSKKEQIMTLKNSLFQWLFPSEGEISE